MSDDLTFRSVGLTHVGHVREHNEDAWLARPEIGLWAVADGLGGHARGEVASAAIVAALDRLPAPVDARGHLRAVLGIGWRDVQGQRMFQGIHGDVHIAAPLALVAVVARACAALWR